MTKKEINLEVARIAGYNEDKKTFTRLVVESRINIQELQKMWSLGQRQKETGAFQ